MTKIIALVLVLVASACGDNITPGTELACAASTDAVAENVCARFFGPDAQTFVCEDGADMAELASTLGMTACATNQKVTCCY